MLKRMKAIALTTVLILPALPVHETVAQATAAPAAIQSCLTNVYCTIALVVVGGVSYWNVTQNGQTENFAIEQDGEYLEDSEGETEVWEDRVWANSLSEAREKCRAFAWANKVIYVGVRPARGNAYICRVRTYRA